MSLNNNNPYNDLLGLMRTQGKYHNPLVPLVGNGGNRDRNSYNALI